MIQCQLKLSPDCSGVAEVHFSTLDTGPGDACIACGKVFQHKFPHVIDSLSIFALETAQAEAPRA